MSLRRSRAAAALAALALAGPMLMWWFAADQEADRRASRIEMRAHQGVRDLETRLAARVDARLESLRESESQRPWYHYQAWFHDPRGVPEAIALTPSPLADGPLDALVAGHFLVDASGRVSSPGPLPPGLDAHGAALLRMAPDGPFRSMRLTPLAAVQNLQPHAILERVRQHGTVEAADLDLAVLGEGVDVHVTPLRWARVPVGATHEIVALRAVELPGGATVQGFVLDRAGLDAWAAGALPARGTGLAAAPRHVRMSWIGGAWRAHVDDVAAVEAARVAAVDVRARARRRFAVLAALVTLAAGAALGLLVQGERLARRRAAFAAMAAHELRTPVASLRLHAEMIADGLGDPGRTGEYARLVAEEARRLGRLVDNVLGATRLERGSLAASPRDGELVEAVRGILEGRRLPLERAGMQVRFRAERDSVRAFFDPDALAEIVGNLLDNAERHGYRAGGRTVEVTVLDDPAVIVADDGPGVPRPRRAGLFRPFRTARPEGAGLGLGLAMARALAAAQGGDVELLDAPGAQFRLSLRRA